MSPTASTTADAPLLIADDPVLDMLNTVVSVNGQSHDFQQNDVDVPDWLVRAGWPVESVAGRYSPGVLLAVTRHLREVIRALVETCKASCVASADALNVFLRQMPSHPVLVWENGTLHVKRPRPTDSVEQCLVPLAEAAAHLLAEGDFQLMRVCEHPEYTLRFYDRTRSHKHRWCSMTVYGNRHKVVEYRKRQQG